MMDGEELKIRVLVVEDEEAMATAIRRTLQNFSSTLESLKRQISFELSYQTTLKESLEALDHKEYDLILLDYKLPDGNGIEILNKIKDLSDPPIAIMMTAYANYETAVMATKLGAFDFLPKPFSVEELRMAIKKATNHLVLIRQARSFEEEKKKIRFNFISILSHELKAPLGAIEGYLNILERGTEKLSKDDYDKMISRSKERLLGMRKLILDLLDLTRIESGEKRRNLTTMNVTTILSDVIELLQLDADKRKIKIESASAKEISLFGDTLEIQIILTNLISNAIKYNREGGKVTVSLNDSSEKLKIAVTDTGIGIEKDDLGRLFNEFVRIKNEETVHILGSGLGLSTVKKIAHLYKGDVKVLSTVGVGSTFEVELYKDCG